jgi:hypothetical protein
MLRTESLRRTLLLTVALAFAAPSTLSGCKKPETTAEAEDEDEDSDKKSKKKKKKGSDDEDGEKKSKKKIAKTPDGVKLSFEKKPGTKIDVAVSEVNAKGDITCFGGLDCTLKLEKLPDGTKVKVGDIVGESKNDRVSVKFDMGDAIAKAAPGDAMKYDKTIDPERSVELEFPDGAKVTEKLPGITTKYMIESELKKQLANGTPVLFGKEADAPQTTHTVLNLAGSLGMDNVMGPAKTMAEVDRVAVEEQLPKRPGNKKCKGYKATGETGPGREADLFLVDWEVKLVERRTGKVIETKKFDAPTRCPMFAQGNETTSYPDSRAVTMWLRSKR